MDEDALLHAIVNGDDASRSVYADWLEEHGDIARAEFLRVQEQLIGGDQRTIVDEAMKRLREVGAASEVSWRMKISRARVRGCKPSTEVLGRLEWGCPMNWGLLVTTDQPNVRTCTQCRESVHYATTDLEHEELADRQVRFAVDVCMMRVPRLRIESRVAPPVQPQVFRTSNPPPPTWNPPPPTWNPPPPRPEMRVCIFCGTSVPLLLPCDRCGRGE